jgi:signal transduction histidine kinase
MVDIAAETAQAEKSSSRRQDTASKRDLALCVAAVAVILTLFISIDAVELLFKMTRHHEDWDLDEILVSLPALTFVMAWYSFPQLRDAQRLESLGRLAGGLAHELNNMLQPAITLAQLTLKKETLEQETRVNLETILQASESSREIVRKALTFAGAKSAQKEEIVLSTCLKEVVDFSRVLLPSTVEVELEIAEHPQLALINRTELTQIITNLMTNAARAMNFKGTLTIALTVEELLEEDMAVQGLPAGAYFKMLVSDNGGGMSDDIQRRLFDPFFTTAEAWENVGLGLTVVHGIIRQWHGKISVWSKPDHGTCFTILIPVAGT